MAVIFPGEAVKEYGTEMVDTPLLLAEVWRMIGRGTKLDETVQNVSSLLTDRTRVARLLVRELDLDKHGLETLAFAPAEGGDGLLTEPRSGHPPELSVRILAWARGGRAVRRQDPDADPALVEAIVPRGVRGDVVLVPLSDPDGPRGVLGLISAENDRFGDEEERLAEMLIEPFSAAWEHDRRYRALETIRAAAEADKQALLAKLGRRELSDAVVGADSGLRDVMDRVELVARSDVPVLLLGETGTGKEVIARLIHMQSPRSAGPFLRVNCGAIPLELIDSHLFGHDKGAFTGAVETRPGWFERASGGTLLLDEVGELPPAAQVRLLRILQDGWLERVGGRTPIHVDVRVVAATHRDLANMVSLGSFRADLWYRIAVFPVALPPLRERIEDIPALARHFAQRAAVRFVLPTVLPTPEDIHLLCGYPWPGNIRELAAVIDRAAILGNGRRLEVSAALGITAGPAAGPAPEAALKGVSSSRQPAILPLDEMVKQHIESALAACRGRIEGPRGAAAALRINPHTLRARMRKLKIDWARFREAG